MNNVQQLTSLFNVNGLFGKKNNNRGMLLSLLSIGIGTFSDLDNKRKWK